MLHMFFAVPCEPYQVDPVAAKALDLLFILHADHEQNASTSTVRLAGSTGANPYAAISAGVAALWGPAHGGRQRGGAGDARADRHGGQHPEVPGDGQGQVEPFPPDGLRPSRLQELRSARQDHPRDVSRGAARKLGRTDNPLFELALRLEEIALKDDYFISRKLYPNVDFYSGIIYSAIGIPRSMFTVMFAIARTVGWVAHWQEMISDPAMRIGRPRQLYTGPTRRDYMPDRAQTPLGFGELVALQPRAAFARRIGLTVHWADRRLADADRGGNTVASIRLVVHLRSARRGGRGCARGRAARAAR